LRTRGGGEAVKATPPPTCAGLRVYWERKGFLINVYSSPQKNKRHCSSKRKRTKKKRKKRYLSMNKFFSKLGKNYMLFG
jgi:hypothetical protein